MADLMRVCRDQSETWDSACAAPHDGKVLIRSCTALDDLSHGPLQPLVSCREEPQGAERQGGRREFLAQGKGGAHLKANEPEE